EVEDVLLASLTEVVEPGDDAVSLGPIAGMRFDRLQQVFGASVMQEEDTLADAPQRRRPELATVGATLCDTILQANAHIVDQQVRIQVDLLIAQRGNWRLTSRQLRRVAQVAADLVERILAGLSALAKAHWLRRREKRAEHRE